MNIPLQKYEVINLDDEEECSTFIKTFGSLAGEALARALGMKGRNTGFRATLLSKYAFAKWTAIAERRNGSIWNAMKYEAICDSLYEQMPKKDQW